MGGPVGLFGGDVLTLIALASLGALIAAAAIGALLYRQRQVEEEPAAPAPRSARIAVSDVAAVPGGRRLLLVRRDNVEHLILIGGPSDVVVEANIIRQRAPAPGPRPAAPRSAQPQTLRPAAAAPSAMAPSATPASAPVGAAQAPARGEARAVDPAMQERLRAASTALALRQAAAQPGQPALKRDAATAPAAAGSAVAGLAAGVAALTAAAGSRTRPAAEDNGKAAQSAEADSAQAHFAPEKPTEAEAAPETPEPNGEEPAAPAAAADGEPAGEDDEGRAVFGLRGTTTPASSSGSETGKVETEKAPDPTAAHDAEPQTLPAMAEAEEAGEPASQEPAAEVTGVAPSPQSEPAPDAGQPTRPETQSPAPAQGAAAPESAPLAVEEAAGQRPEPTARPDSPAAQRAPVAPLSGFAPGRGTTLGDLAERLEEALIQQAATGASAELSQPAAVPAAEAMPPSPAAPQRDEATVSRGHAAEKDEAAVIDFAARRRPGTDSLEDEMARLLGELTRDTTRC